jgi:hypothetical protein
VKKYINHPSDDSDVSYSIQESTYSLDARKVIKTFGFRQPYYFTCENGLEFSLICLLKTNFVLIALKDPLVYDAKQEISDFKNWVLNQGCSSDSLSHAGRFYPEVDYFLG